MHIEILAPGILSLIQDAGRFGQHGIGLTSGGPMDPTAFKWANRLLHNDPHATALEVTVGGIKIKSHGRTRVAITGARVGVSINGRAQPQWQSLDLNPGDTLALAYATEGCRIYLAVAGGFTLAKQFGSNSTVVREGVGGLNGQALRAGDTLACGGLSGPYPAHQCLPAPLRPHYCDQVTLRVIRGYQQAHFSRREQALFFQSEFKVGASCDRMGYRLSGPRVRCDMDGILSEGICLGAIQVPKDGQPIILLNDRQTIGGYPKLGSVLSLDLAKLAQLGSGGRVKFAAITIDDAHNLLALAQHKFANSQTESLEA